MYDTESGDEIGEWFMPNAQSAVENCTLHNINFIPTTDGSDLLVSGNYQAGTWVTDWTDPANPSILAFADPPPPGRDSDSWWCMVDLLVQRFPLRDRDHQGPERLRPGRPAR
jgi:hypothetical protein